MKTLTEGIFKNVINTSVLEPEGHHSENFQARRVKNRTTGRSDLCTGGSLKFLNPPETAGLKRAKLLWQFILEFPLWKIKGDTNP